MIRMKTKKYGYILLLPCFLFLVVFLILPLFAMLLSTIFNQGQFTFKGYYSMLKDSYFQQVFWRSLKLSLISTVVCALLGFPVSYFISKLTRRKGLYIALALFPLMTSPVVRSFSWMVILGKKGMINTALMSANIISSPLSMLYNEFSIVMGFIQLMLPMMILSLVGVMENIDDDLICAAGSLGASQTKAFWKVIFPLSSPGLISGSVLVFCGCLTAYTTPQLLGGSKSRVLSTLIYQNAMSLNDWVSASIVAVIMIVVSVTVTECINKLAQKTSSVS